MRSLITRIGAGLSLLLLPSVASAAFCWNEGDGGTLVLALGASEGNLFSLYGHRVLPAGKTCQGASRVPATAAASITGSQVLLGIQIHATGDCVSSRRQIILNLNTLAGSGAFRNDDGVEGTVTLSPIGC